jgi:DNA-binding IclR family transcriptional regulator
MSRREKMEKGLSPKAMALLDYFEANEEDGVVDFSPPRQHDFCRHINISLSHARRLVGELKEYNLVTNDKKRSHFRLLSRGG